MQNPNTALDYAKIGHLDDFGFDSQLVKSLVQRIEVSADKRIRIVFGFQDMLENFGKESAGK